MKQKLDFQMLFESTSNCKVSVSLLTQSAPTSSAGCETCGCWKRRSRPSPTSSRMNTARCLTPMTVSSAPLWRRRGSIQRRTTWTLTVSGEWLSDAWQDVRYKEPARTMSNCTLNVVRTAKLLFIVSNVVTVHVKHTRYDACLVPLTYETPTTEINTLK